MRLPSRPLLSLIVLVLGLSTTQQAYAYLDPGTGSFLLQMLIAGALGAYLYIKLAWYKTKMFFVGLFGGNQEDPTDSAEAKNDDSDETRS